MPYRFVTERHDYSDYASGRVFYGQPGHPAFPVRLASEILQRCIAFRATQGASGPCVLYDPCCGGAYHLSTLGYLHREALHTIIGSDVDAEIVEIAGRNLSLLTLAGLERRIAELSHLQEQYGKVSHTVALQSAQKLRQRLLQLMGPHPITVRCFVADGTDSQALCERLGGQPVDVVISDVPYGVRSSWRGRAATREAKLSPVGQLLEALLPQLAEQSVVAIAADKQQTLEHKSYRRVERFQIGKRRIVLLQPVAQ